jgi:hypothetical protein
VLRRHITGNRDTIGGFGDTLGKIDTAGVEDTYSITGNRDTIGGFGDTLGTVDTAGVEDGSRYCGHIMCWDPSRYQEHSTGRYWC